MLGFAGETEFDLRFRLFDIPVRVHPMFWLSSAWMVWDGDNIPFTLLGVLCMFISILVHELGHAALMRRYGYPSEIVLYFLGGYATATQLSPWRNIRMSAAGPLAGLALSALIYLLLMTMVENPLRFYVDFQSPMSLIVRVSLFVGVFVNIMNLIPCLPLDGGRIMESLITLFGNRGRGNQELVLQISTVVAGAVALRCAYCMNSEDAVIPSMAFNWLPDPHRTILSFLQPDPKFLMIFFGMLCAQNVIALNNLKRWR